MLSSDIDDWRITFVDTGLSANIGQRLKAVEKFLQDEDVFLANYSDGLSDVNLAELTETFLRSNRVACLVSVKPAASFHLITVDGDSLVKSIEHIANSGARINGGFFVFRREVFQYIKDGEELVEEPFRRLISEGQLLSYAHKKFWACMDTFKELQILADLYGRGKAPWAIWNDKLNPRALLSWIYPPRLNFPRKYHADGFECHR